MVPEASRHPDSGEQAGPLPLPINHGELEVSVLHHLRLSQIKCLSQTWAAHLCTMKMRKSRGPYFVMLLLIFY